MAAAAQWPVVMVVVAAAVTVACVGGDMDADRSECADQLVGLAPCLQYVQGQARSPAPDCCGGLRQVMDKSPKCLCVLVKDKDDPNLGIKINASLALALPSACGVTKANVSHCPQLLHLPPSSKDAAIFSPGGDKGSAAAPAKDNPASTTNSRAQQAASGGAASSPASHWRRCWSATLRCSYPRTSRPPPPSRPSPCMHVCLVRRSRAGEPMELASWYTSTAYRRLCLGE